MALLFPNPGIIASMQRVPSAPPALVVPTARYWRLVILARPYEITTADIAEIEFATTIGGSNIALSKTYAASEGTASAAFDGNAATQWAPNKSNLPGKWISVDFGSAIQPAEVRVRAFSTIGGRTPTVYCLQASDDNSTWQSVCILEYGVFGNGELKALPVVAQDMTAAESNARAWRIFITNIVTPANNETRVNEITFHPTFGGSALGAQADFAWSAKSHSGAGTSGRAGPAFDANTSSVSIQNEGSLLPVHWGFARATPVGVMEECQINPAGAAGEKITEMDVQWSPDGVNWTTKKSFTGIGSWTNGTFKSFDLR